MKQLAKKYTYRFLKITYLVRYLGDAFFYVFLFVYLGSLNFDTGEIGLISALIPLAALFGNFIFKRLALNVNINKILMIIISVLEVSIALIFAVFPSQSYLFYLILITFVSIFNGPYYSLLDGYSGTYILQAKKQYSNMRMMGTLSYVIAPLIGAFLMERGFISYTTLFYLGALFMLLALVLTLFLPKTIITEEIVNNEKLILRQYPEFLIHLLFIFLVVGLAFVSDNFFALYLTKERGVSDGIYGYVVAATIFVELIIFIFIIYKKNMFRHPLFSYFFVGLTLLSRPLSIALNLPNSVIFVLSLLRGLAWGYYIVFNMLFIARLVPLARLTSALFISSIAMTLSRIITSLAMGELLKVLSYENVFMIVCALIAFGSALTILFRYRLNQKQKAKIPT